MDSLDRTVGGEISDFSSMFGGVYDLIRRNCHKSSLHLAWQFAKELMMRYETLEKKFDFFKATKLYREFHDKFDLIVEFLGLLESDVMEMQRYVRDIFFHCFKSKKFRVIVNRETQQFSIIITCATFRIDQIPAVLCGTLLELDVELQSRVAEFGVRSVLRGMWLEGILALVNHGCKWPLFFTEPDIYGRVAIDAKAHDNVPEDVEWVEMDPTDPKQWPKLREHLQTRVAILLACGGGELRVCYEKSCQSLDFICNCGDCL